MLIWYGYSRRARMQLGLLSDVAIILSHSYSLSSDVCKLVRNTTTSVEQFGGTVSTLYSRYFSSLI